MLIKSKKGPYLFTGCTHTGFFKILEEAKQVAGENIFFHTGGTQLNQAFKHKIQSHVGKLKSLNVTQVSPSHCSAADRVQKPFKMVFGTNYLASKSSSLSAFKVNGGAKKEITRGEIPDASTHGNPS